MEYTTTYTLDRAALRRRVVLRPTHDAVELAEIDVSELIRRCAAEYERFSATGQQDTSYAYELFRRALVAHDQEAWVYIYQQYCRLVERWVRRNSAFDDASENSDALVSAAFTRFWQAIGPERFASFPSVASLLHYLQCCAASVVIDNIRQRQRDCTVPLALFAPEHEAVCVPEDAAMENLNRLEFWRFIAERLRCDAEKVVIYRSFVLGEKPAEIFAARTELFDRVAEVYAIKRNVLDRLSRDPELQAML
jgi:DNA-directed RNA polymerase specialized sigma24 family protein